MAHERVFGICENKCRVEVPKHTEYEETRTMVEQNTQSILDLQNDIDTNTQGITDLQTVDELFRTQITNLNTLTSTLSAKLTDSGWKTLKADGTYTFYDISNAIKYRLKNGMIYIEGKLSRFGASTGTTVTIGTLPSGYRPTIEIRTAIPCVDYTYATAKGVIVYISTTGVLSIYKSFEDSVEYADIPINISFPV